MRGACVNEPAVEARHLSKRFRVGGETVHALREVSFRIDPAAVTGLIGPPGTHGAASREARANDSAEDLATPAPMLSGINIAPPPVRKPDAKVFEYKVLTPKDKALGGKLDAERLEEALNAYAQEGWRVVAAVAGSIHGVTSATREELVIILER